MARILSWLKPNRLDGQIYVLALLCFFAIALPTVTGISAINYHRQKLIPLFAPFLGSWLAVACCYGCLPWKSIFSKSVFLMLCFLSFGLFVFAASYSGVWLESIMENRRVKAFDYKTLGMFFGAFALTFFLTRFIAWIAPKVSSRSKRILRTQTRVRWMIIFAIGLYLFFLATNFVRADINFLYAGYSSALWLFVPLGCLFYVVIPGLIAFRVKRLWLAVVIVLAYFVVAGAVFFSNVGGIFGNDFEELFFAILLFSLVFALSCFVIRGFYEQAVGVKPWKRLAAPSVFGWLMGVGMGLATLGWFFYEPSTLLFFQGDEKFEIARDIRRLQSSPGARVVGVGENLGPGWGNVITLIAELSDDTPADFFESLSSKVKVAQRITIKEMRPHIETKGIRNQQKTIDIESGTVTTDQLADLIELNQWCRLADLTLKPGVGDRPIQTAGQIHVQGFAEGSVGTFLNLIPSDATIGSIRLGQCEFNRDDWKAVFKAGEFHNLILIIDDIDEQIVEMAKQSNATKLTIVSYSPTTSQTGLLNSNHWELLLHTNVSLQLPHLSIGKSQKWDAVFSSRAASSFRFNPDELTNLSLSKEFVQRASELNFSYGLQTKSDPLSARRMYLPLLDENFAAQAAKFKQLRSLSFDSAWLPSIVGVYSATESRDLARLRGLTKLEELYLPKDAFIGDFRFLQRLPSLRHLQVDSAVASGVPGLPGGTFRAAFCPKLESLVMFSSPDPAMETELAKMTSLKTLTILDAGQLMLEDQRAAEQKRLAAALGNIEVRVLPPVDYQKEIPEHFKQHVNQIRERAAKTYLMPATEKDSP